MNDGLKGIRETYFGSVWDMLMWLSLAGIAVWALAKAVGWINTPLIVEIAPIIFAAFAVGAFFQEQKQFRNEMRQFKNETRSELGGLAARISHLESAKAVR